VSKITGPFHLFSFCSGPARWAQHNPNWREWQFIPACAGNTAIFLTCAVSIFGSSPHARGTPPAFAERTVGDPVHPRMRGEHGLFEPRPLFQRRFIPACAGNTAELIRKWNDKCGSSPHARGTPLSLYVNGTINAVHPRMRGEHADIRRLARSICRFIPACAGNTFASRLSFRRSFGSSPHARGTRQYPCLFIICIAVHPRMRGEHRIGSLLPLYQHGSSPHARGTRHFSVLLP